MTVSSSTNRASFSGNGSTTVFAYNFKIFDQSDLTVILRSSTGVETTQTITTHYTVSGVGSASGGNVTFGSAPASGVTVVILREQPLTQGLDLVANDPFPSASFEDQLDKLTFMVQQHDEELGRAIKASKTNTISGAEFLISATDRASKVFAFDSSGDLSITQELGTFKGNWAASTAYVERDLVKDTTTNNVFIVNSAHTSSGSQPLTTNTNSAKYTLIIDVSNPAGDLTVGDDLSLTSDAAVLGFGADTDVTLTHVPDTGLLLNSTMALQFNDASQSINAPSATVLDINATLIDVNGNLDVSGTITLGSGAVISEAELEALDDVTPGTVAASKAVIVDSNKDAASFRNLTATGAVTGGSFVIGSADINENDLEAIDGITAGTVAASKAMVVDSNKDITGARNITLTGELDAGSLDISGDVDIDGTLEADAITINGTAIGSIYSVIAGSSSIVTTGALNSGSITSGFGTINTGSSNITTTGVGSFGSLDISGDIDVDGTTNLDIVDIDGAVDMASTLAVGGVVTANAGVVVDNITIDGTEIDLSSGDLTIDVAGNIILDADGGFVAVKDAGTEIGNLGNSSSDFVITSSVQDKDIIFKGNDNGSVITALTLDMSDAGKATFNGQITSNAGSIILDNSSNIPNLNFFESGAQKYAIGESANIGGGGAGFYDHYAVAGKGLRFFTGAAERIRIDSSGNVGIGTTSSAVPLLVAKDGANHTSAAINIRSTQNGGYGSILNFESTNSSGTAVTAASIGTHGAENYSSTATTSSNLMFSTVGDGTLAERMRIDSSGNVLVGTTSSTPHTGTSTGVAILNDGGVFFTRNGADCLNVNRASDDGDIAVFRKDGTIVGSIGTDATDIYIGTGDTGIRFNDAVDGILPYNTSTGSQSDDVLDLGFSSHRFDDIFATNGTIQTSDQNEKRDISGLTSTEMKVGKRISALFKTFKFKSKVTAKGDAARTHTGIIAQDVQAAFSAEGLDASKYALWCSDTWTNDDGSEQTRMGIRYPELLSFLSAYNEQRFTDIEARITVLEGS